MHLYSRVTCLITNCESPLFCNSINVSKPKIKASYSAFLFKQFGHISHKTLVGVLSGELINTPT